MVLILYGIAAMLYEKYSTEQKSAKPVENGEFVKS